jgi:insulysin
LLKARGLANGLSSGDYGGEPRSFSFFKISIDLTEDGLEKIDEVVEACFQYIAMLREVGTGEDGFPSYIYEEYGACCFGTDMQCSNVPPTLTSRQRLLLA